jgi:hypothetical protein
MRTIGEPPESPYLNGKEAIVYLRFPSMKALYAAIARGNVPVCRRGGKLLFDKRELDAAVRGTTLLEQQRALRRRA